MISLRWRLKVYQLLHSKLRGHKTEDLRTYCPTSLKWHILQIITRSLSGQCTLFNQRPNPMFIELWYSLSSFPGLKGMTCITTSMHPVIRPPILALNKAPRFEFTIVEVGFWLRISLRKLLRYCWVMAANFDKVLKHHSPNPVYQLSTLLRYSH